MKVLQEPNLEASFILARNKEIRLLAHICDFKYIEIFEIKFKPCQKNYFLKYILSGPMQVNRIQSNYTCKISTTGDISNYNTNLCGSRYVTSFHLNIYIITNIYIIYVHFIILYCQLVYYTQKMLSFWSNSEARHQTMTFYILLKSHIS